MCFFPRWAFRQSRPAHWTTSHETGEMPVILRPALFTLYRTFNDTKRAVTCSIVLEFSSAPASKPRAPPIAFTRSRTIFFAFSSSEQTRTSQSTVLERSFRSSALTLLKAVTTPTVFGTTEAASSPADPAQTPTVLVARPPTAVSRGTDTFTKTCPGLKLGLTVFRVSSKAVKGTVSTITSACKTALSLLDPDTRTGRLAVVVIVFAASTALSGLLEPMTTWWPAIAHLRARPNPSSPAPPSTAILRFSVWFYSLLNCEGLV